MTTTVRKPRPAKKTGDPTQDKTQITEIGRAHV